MADILGGEPSSSSSSSNKRRRFAKAAVAGIGPALCERLRVETLHLCATSGSLLGAAGPFHHAPCSLLPYPFPAPLFAEALALAKPFNSLIDRVARDVDWLTRVVRTTVEHDPFTRKLLEQLETVHAEGAAQSLQLSINRSDYMVDQSSDASSARILQVELNTVSVSFVSLGAKMSQVHAQSMARLACDADEAIKEQIVRGRPALSRVLEGDGAALPANQCASNVARGLALAHAEYLKGRPAGGGDVTVAVVMVVQPNERNVVDQRGIEHALWAQHKVPLVRATLADIQERGTIGTGGELLLAPGQGGGSGGVGVGSEVRAAGRQYAASVVYFRAGYTPDDFPGDAEWQARLLIERSSAVKCPCLAQHLAGTKKVQQQLAVPGELERFTSSAAEAAQLRACFAKLYGLEEGGGAAGGGAVAPVAEIVAEAVRNPDGYVLKPQREGGGNNLYGTELAEALRAMSPAERASYILMERIRPPSCPMPLMREADLDGGGCTCELGVYGVGLTDGTRELVNECAGHLLRVKLDGVDEGGVCAGFAVLSSPALY